MARLRALHHGEFVMKKVLLGAAVAAMAAGSIASPASAQYRDRDYRTDRDYRNDRRGDIAADIATGIAVIGGVAAVIAAVDRDGGRYGYDNRYRYRDGYSAAVNACGYQAERYGGGNVRVTDVDRRSGDRYRVEGVVEGGGYGYDRYDRYDRRYGNRGYGERFTCVAYGNGRIAEFRTRR
jgi:hypothetical protein